MNWFFWLHCSCLTFSFFSFITFSLLLVLYNVSAAQLLGFPASPVFVFYLIFFCSSRSFWWFVFCHTFYVAARLVQCFILSNACPFDCVKSVHIRSYSGPYFPAFGLNTERYSVSLRIQSECGKIWTRITPNTDTFYAVLALILRIFIKQILLF